MILLTHPTGHASVRHAALGLHRAGLLGEFWTGLNLPIPAWANRWLPAGLSQDLQRRSFPEELRRKIRSHPWREASRLLAGRLGLGTLTQPMNGACSLDAVSQALDRHVSRRLGESRFTGVYAFEHGAEVSFRAARELNQLAIYEQVTGHWKEWQRLFDEEADAHPDWAATLGARPELQALTERSDTELGLAQVVIVPTTFIKRTLEQSAVMRARVAVIPHGIVPSASITTLGERTPLTESGKLRVLYVGVSLAAQGHSLPLRCRQQPGRGGRTHCRFASPGHLLPRPRSAVETVPARGGALARRRTPADAAP
jgi:starch synthase